jgi:hypothetical protein
LPNPLSSIASDASDVASRHVSEFLRDGLKTLPVSWSISAIHAGRD